MLSYIIFNCYILFSFLSYSEQALHRLSPVPSNFHQDSTSPSGQMLLVDSAAGAVVCEIDEFHGVVDGSKLSPEAATELATEATSELPSPSVPNSAVTVTEDMFIGTDDHFFQIQRPVSKVFSLSNESFLNTVTCDPAATDHNRSTGSSGDVSKDNAKLMSTWLKKVSPDPDSPSSIRSAGSSPKLPYRGPSSSITPKLIRPVLLRETTSDSAMSHFHSSSSPPQHHHPYHSASSLSLPNNSKSRSFSQPPLSEEDDPELHSTLAAAILAESSQSYWLHRPENVCNNQTHQNNDCDSLNSIWHCRCKDKKAKQSKKKKQKKKQR